MPIEPPKRGPGRPRKEESGPYNPSTHIPRISSPSDQPDERHVLSPAPQDPNADVPMREGAKAVVTASEDDKAKPSEKEAAEEFEAVQRLRERAAKAFMVEGAPIAQAAFEDDDKEPSVPVTLKRDYWPLDGSERKLAGETHDMTPAEAEKSQELGVADVAVRKLKK